eukprot:CAMPEP_0168612310 /NCGR_PEP_ID=MMETSP0449_2-20121227/2847_1 /TAXON_ID=1082188 /ORGANISM="Strombidium rassoulzadegani, Strain ras09" /LENGTH=88 /DNA_ID=CAMNT_0008652863 /DNA_START=115 /DNA_END=381 /DNA_ORIENTATION=-
MKDVQARATVSGSALSSHQKTTGKELGGCHSTCARPAFGAQRDTRQPGWFVSDTVSAGSRLPTPTPLTPGVSTSKESEAQPPTEPVAQ